MFFYTSLVSSPMLSISSYPIIYYLIPRSILLSYLVSNPMLSISSYLIIYYLIPPSIVLLYIVLSLVSCVFITLFAVHDPCTVNPCENGGHCVPFGGKALCRCVASNFGEFCKCMTMVTLSVLITMMMMMIMRRRRRTPPPPTTMMMTIMMTP